MRKIAVADEARRGEIIDAWGPHVCWMLRALRKLPDADGSFYRGSTMKLSDLKLNYVTGRLVRLAAFTSTSRSVEMAMAMAGPDGTILQIRAFTGKDISNFSLYSAEQEVLMVPNKSFIVTKRSQKTFVLKDASTKTMPCIDLCEVRTGEQLRA